MFFTKIPYRKDSNHNLVPREVLAYRYKSIKQLSFVHSFFQWENITAWRELVIKHNIDVTDITNEDQICIFNHGKFYDCFKAYVPSTILII